MSKIRPLTPEEARQSIVMRIAPTVDRARQRVVAAGLRPYRVFLTWTLWVLANSKGEPRLPVVLTTERGQGVEYLLGRVEILPTPRVMSLDSVSLSSSGAGIVPMGSVRIDQISALYTRDVLMGVAVPANELPFKGQTPDEKHIPEPYEFFYEVVEDGRGDCAPKRERFRIMSEPMRRADKIDWTLMLERSTGDRTRDDESSIGKGVE